MRVAVLLSGRAQFSVYYGGALVRWTHEVYRQLRPEIEVTVFGFPTDPSTRYPLPHETSAWYRACLAMAKVPLLRRWEDEVWLRALIARLRSFDLVHIHNRPQWAPALRRLGYRGRIIVHLQNDHLGHWSAEMLDDLAPHLDAVVVCSTYIGEQFCHKSGALAKKTKLIFNGVNRELFFPREELREPKTIFFVGSFIPNKGVLQLARAYDRVLEVHPDAKLVVGGSAQFGVNRETPYIRQVREVAESIRERTGVEIQFTGSLHHDKELPAWFQRATVFSCPSLFQEPFGLVNAEAMACATPAVGTNRGGVPEVLGAGGVTIDPENTEEFAAALSSLLADPGERLRLGRAGLERTRTVFDWRVIAENWREFLAHFA
jgi:glycosyltransferase involved in cell wall biosynthesis